MSVPGETFMKIVFSKYIESVIIQIMKEGHYGH